jgi:AcrR family transcriptional regulator
VSRWQPDARGRLEKAAIELFSDRGFDDTTVAEIAGRAGLTERTFFRHFADKRDVLFSGTTAFNEAFVRPIADAPPSLAPIDVVARGLEATADRLEDHRGRDFARRRQAILHATPELQERELIKLASLSATIAETLRRRGLGEPAASLTAEVTIAVFRVAFERWIDESNRKGLHELIRESLDQIKVLTAA